MALDPQVNFILNLKNMTIFLQVLSMASYDKLLLNR
jgi:hypothetical protein